MPYANQPRLYAPSYLTEPPFVHYHGSLYASNLASIRLCRRCRALLAPVGCRPHFPALHTPVQINAPRQNGELYDESRPYLLYTVCRRYRLPSDHRMSMSLANMSRQLQRRTSGRAARAARISIRTRSTVLWSSTALRGVIGARTRLAAHAYAAYSATGAWVLAGLSSARADVGRPTRKEIRVGIRHAQASENYGRVESTSCEYAAITGTHKGSHCSSRRIGLHNTVQASYIGTAHSGLSSCQSVHIVASG